MLHFSWAITPIVVGVHQYGRSGSNPERFPNIISNFPSHVKQGAACAVENDPNQTLQATVGEAFFLMFFGVSAGFGFSAADHKVVRRVIRQTPAAPELVR